MAQLFSERANAITHLVLGVLVLLVVTTIAVAIGLDHSSYNTGAYVEKEQPLLFPHNHHVAQDGISCRYCHSAVDVAPRAGMPPTQTCMNCHSQIWADSPYLEPVRTSWRTNEPIAWTKVHDLPDFVYFDHSAHVTKGVGCSTCHGDVERMTIAYQVAPLTMEWCLACHREPERYLRPIRAVYDTGWQPPRNQRARGLELRKAYAVMAPSVLTSCSTCHR